MSEAIWERIILALDTRESAEALRWLNSYPEIRIVKVGLELFSAQGMGFVNYLKTRGYKVFLDLKLHDIPRTMARAGEVILRQHVDFLSVHIAAGGRALEELVAVKGRLGAPTRILGVTVLTSLEEKEWSELYPGTTLMGTVTGLAELGIRMGLDGLITSGWELKELRARWGSSPLLVVPGVRLPHEPLQDQRRVMTPWEAISLGASYIVMGRSLTAHPNPEEVRRILERGEQG